MIVTWTILGIIVLLVLWFVGVFNGIVVLRNRTQEAWSDIDVQLKRRHDLIPNLVETVKGYATHESSVFEKVTEARADAISAKSPADISDKENVLTGALKSVFAVAEAYPDLKASQNFQQLQTDLVDTEDKIQAARRFYNGNVRDLNIKIESFPANLIAGSFGFKEMELFQTTSESEKQPVNVKF